MLLLVISDIKSGGAALHYLLILIIMILHILVWTRWPPFCKRHFQLCFKVKIGKWHHTPWNSPCCIEWKQSDPIFSKESPGHNESSFVLECSAWCRQWYYIGYTPNHHINQCKTNDLVNMRVVKILLTFKPIIRSRRTADGVILHK